MKLISKDTPLAEIILRKYEKPQKLNRRDLVRKLCLSLGLLQPGDSRDVIVDVLFVMLENQLLNSEEVKEKVLELRKDEGLSTQGTASSNIRRQLKRLRDFNLIEKVGNDYRISENATLEEIFKEKIEKFLVPSIIERVKEYIKATDLAFKKSISEGVQEKIQPPEAEPKDF